MNIKNISQNKKGKLNNKTFMFTGKLANFSRAEAMKVATKSLKSAVS